MSMQNRPYQTKFTKDIFDAWESGATDVLGVMPTGGGKTKVFSDIIRQVGGVAIAHRRELVGQMSATLARNEVYHRLVAPDAVIREAVTRHMQDFGRSYHDSNASVAAAGVDTLIGRDLGAWAQRVPLVVTDEGHHVLKDNKWGKARAMFPNARGLGVTAVPERADGKGLGRGADGVYDYMVVGPDTTELIRQGYLCNYRIYAPTSDINLASVPVSDATGDYSKTALVEATRRSGMVGDIVTSYLKIAPGTLGVSFLPSVELAAETAANFRNAGVPAEVVSAKTPDALRASILRRFAAREVLQLVNVDLFGEGFDLPAIETVSHGRATKSLNLYRQMCGRALRPMPGKAHARLIDHVGNWVTNGIPDAPRVWSLNGRERRSRGAPDDLIPVKACPACTAVFERCLIACPYCGHTPQPRGRTAPELVDGDLYELDPSVLDRLRRAASAIMTDEPRVPYGATAVVRGAVWKRHVEHIRAQAELRDAISWWAGHKRAAGVVDSVAYRVFYLKYGIDVASAQTLNTRDATVLAERVRGDTP